MEKNKNRYIRRNNYFKTGSDRKNLNTKYPLRDEWIKNIYMYV